VSGVLLATEERAIAPEAIEAAARLAEPEGMPVYVFAIARIHGTSLGFPHPGLLPTQAEWEAQRASVDTAVKALKRRGLRSAGRVLGSRKASKRICEEAQRLGCEAIVMGADPPRGSFVSDFMWSQEPQRVRKRAKIPVYLVDAAG
jgi:nucleotide-binding universal stress UspA family protein